MDPAYLRSVTQPEHQRLEQALNLLCPSLNIERYIRLLQRFYAFYQIWEPAMARCLAEALPGFLDSRQKLPLLKADLRALDAEDSACVMEPSRLGALKLDTVGAALGSMYVSEGSTLGGQILARHFRLQLNIEPNSGGSFFFGYGDLTSQRWRTFQAVLASRPASEDQVITDSALATFRLLYDWLPESA
jgi:heme oxygenase (biliverdin-IX-beta and delta-forming)